MQLSFDNSQLPTAYACPTSIVRDWVRLGVGGASDVGRWELHSDSIRRLLDRGKRHGAVRNEALGDQPIGRVVDVEPLVPLGHERDQHVASEAALLEYDPRP